MLSCQFRDGLVWASALSPAFVSGRQLTAALRALERSTRFPRGTGLLVDARAISPGARRHTRAELSVATLDLVNMGIARCALVPVAARIAQAELFAGVALAESLPMAVFLDPEPALRWLQGGGTPNAE
jgi:hypothetical protein